MSRVSSWYHKAKVTYDFHRGQIEVHGATNWKMKDTAKELSRSIGSISTDLKMVEFTLRDNSLMALDRQEVLRRIRKVSFTCNVCSLPNVQHGDLKECFDALKDEVDRLRGVCDKVRRLSREVTSELEDVQ